jgi:HAE1 family hydrophobic/amphiphilic exporter-1
MFLSDLSIKQPVLATMLAVTLVTLGIYSYNQLAIDQFPDVEIPVLTVQTIYPGAPRDVEREVTKRIEEALNTISGVRHIASTTTEGLSAVVVEFRLGTRINNAQQDAQAKINAIRADFPKDMKEPVIQRIDFNAMPIVSIAVESRTADIKTLSSVAEKLIKKHIETVAGVGQVNLVGMARREIQILLDRDKLKAYGLTYAQAAAALERENMDVPLPGTRAGQTEPLVRVAGSSDPGIIRPTHRPTGTAVRSICRWWRAWWTASRSAHRVPHRRPLGFRSTWSNSPARTPWKRTRSSTPSAKSMPSFRRISGCESRGSFHLHSRIRGRPVTLVLGGLLTVLIVFLFLNSWRSTVIGWRSPSP